MMDSVKKIRRFAAGCRRRLVFNRVSGMLARLFSAFLAFSLILTILFSAYPWVVLPLVWISGTAILVIAAAVIITVTLFRAPTLIQSVRKAENRSELKHPSLSIALELSSQTSAGSESLKKHVYERAAREIERLKEVRLTESRTKLYAATVLLLLITVGSSIYFPQRLYSYWKLIFTVAENQKAEVRPGSITVPLNSPLTLHLTGPAHYPSAKLDLLTRDGSTRSRHFLRPDSSGGFSFRIDSVREDMIYQFSLAQALSPETVTVARPPMLRSLQIKLDPPAYTKQKPRTLNAGQGNMNIYAGTEVSCVLESGELDQAALIFGRDTFDLEVEGKRARGKFKVWRSGKYTFRLKDTLGQTNDSLPNYMITTIPDEKPLARIIKPTDNKALTTAQVETLWVEGIDDIGIRDMRLQWCRSGFCGEEKPQSWNLTDRGRPPIIRKNLVWDLTELSLYPGDTVFYWLRVRDNKPFGKAQIARSDTLWFRVPSFEEIHKQIARNEQYAQKKLGEVKGRQENISSAVEELMKSAVGSQELSWDQKRIMEDIQNQMNSQADSLQKALQSLQKSMEALKEDGKMNDELFKKMEQVKESMEQLAKEFGKNPFLSDKEEKLSLDDMRQAAGKLQEMLPEMSERLDQTLQFMEMLKREKNISDLALRAENLSEEQSELAFSDEDASIKERQQELLDRIDSLSRDMREQFKKEKQPGPSSGNVDQQSKNMRSQLRKNEAPSSKEMNAMSRELMSLSEQLEGRLSSSMMAQMEEDRKLILGMAHDALSLESWQELLRKQAHGRVDDKSTAKAQQALKDGLIKSLARSDSLAMVPPDMVNEITNSYRKAISRAQTVISTMSNSDGTFAMNQSAGALRELANLLLSIASQGDSQSGSSGAGSMMSGLRQASGKQAALNSMMGDMLQSLLGQQGQQGGSQPGGNKPGDGGEQGGGEGAHEARRKAQEAQQAIAQELERLADKYGKEAGESMEKRVRELEQEARRLAQLLQNPPEDIIDQQDRFLSRMLQSTLSLNRKDKGKEDRKGSKSKTVFSDPDAPALGKSIREADTFHILRRRAFEDNYPEEYRSAIREYFDSLGELYLE
ncbi:MAG: DUF4175 family protein [Chitinispirillaceae bacterium]